MTDKHITSGTAADGETEIINVPGHPLLVSAVAFNRLVGRVQELEAEIAAVGAGGVQALSAAPAVQPMQPIITDGAGGLRFKSNALVDALYEHGVKTGLGLNELARMDFTTEDRQQFAQLIGYSLSGYGSLSYVTDEAYAAAERAASPTPPAEQPFVDQKHEDLSDKRVCASSVSDKPGAVYAELPAPTASIGADDAWHEAAMRDFADRTHALRMISHRLDQTQFILSPEKFKEFSDALDAAPKAAPGEQCNWPETCDGKEQEMWEAWALRNRYDMHQHPLHYLFLHPKTNAARQGWKAGLQYAVDQMRKAAPQQEAQEPAARYTIEDVRKARSEGYRNGVESSVPSKITKEMRHAFREKYKEGSIWTDRLDIALEGMLAAAHQPAPAPLSGDVLKKAARYDLLRDCDLDYMAEMYWPGGQVPSGDELDAAIDAALAAQRGRNAG